jgi:hypothetical protein
MVATTPAITPIPPRIATTQARTVITLATMSSDR